MALNTKNLDHSRLGASLIEKGIYGGELSLKNYRELAEMGHQEKPLKEVINKAVRNGLAIDDSLTNFLQQGLTMTDLTDPVKSQEAFNEMSAYGESGVIREEGGVIYKEGFGFTPMPGQTITFQRADGSRYDVTGETPGSENSEAETNPYASMAESIMSGFSDMMSQMQRENAAAEERRRLANLTMQRNQRSASQAPNLQIQGAGSTPKTGGTQGFRRRDNQFTPVYKGLGGFGATAQNNQNMAQYSINT